MHFLSRITSWLPYITLCYIDSRFFLPLEQSRTALLGSRLAASRLREAARWQLILPARALRSSHHHPLALGCLQHSALKVRAPN